MATKKKTVKKIVKSDAKAKAIGGKKIGKKC
jgi:hypothetical protein